MNKALKRFNDVVLVLLILLSGFLFYADTRYVFGNLDENNFTEFDFTFYKTLNPSEEGAGVWRFITTFVSAKFLVIVSVIALAIFILLLSLKKIKNTKENWIDLLAAPMSALMTSGVLCELVLKNIFKRPRPNVLKLTNFSGFSFPSGHTACGVVLYWMLADVLSHLVKKYERRHGEKKKTIVLFKILVSIYRVVSLMIPFFIGYSRIYLGAHFATDVFAGFFLGIIMYLIFTKVYRIIIK